MRSRILLGVLVVLALTAAAAGCARSAGSGDPAGDPGAGQFGAAPAGGEGVDGADGGGADGGGADGGGADGGDGGGTEPSPAPPPEPPAEEEEPPEAPPGGPFVILTIDPGLLLPWPSPADCTSHDPTNVSIVYNASAMIWQVVDGSHYLLAYKRKVDAESGLALAKAFKKHCFIGRGNTRPDRERYIMDYWLEPVLTAPVPPNPDCVSYNPTNLTVADLGALGWRVEDGAHAIALFDTKSDADKAVLVMKHYNRSCYVGRGYTGADRLKYITNWFTTG